MRYSIICTRCGCAQATAPDTANAWDEIHCVECGEFLDTCELHADRHAANYPMQVLNMSRGMILKMARESDPLNDHIVSGKRA